MSFAIPRGSEKGQWRPPDEPVEVELLKAVALVKCPGCGVDSILSGKVHQVAPDGTVSPSYLCPHKPCTFHEWVRLEGWGKR